MPHTKEQQRDRMLKKKALGLCVDCRAPRLPNNCRCQAHKDRQKENRILNGASWKKQTKEDKKNFWSKVRKDVLDKYGRTCACCGESQEELLTIDHVFEDGKKHRAEIGGSHSMYLWLRKNEKSDRFQTMCFSCNIAKFRYGVCPHQKIDTESLLLGVAC